MNSSPRPKSVAALFLIGAFLTGGAVGYAATRAFGGPLVTSQPVSQAQIQTQMRERWKQDLNLAPDQIVKFDALYDRRKAAIQSVRAKHQPAIDSIVAIFQPTIDSLRVTNQQDVMQLLNPSQKAKYQEMIDADKKKADSLKKSGVFK